MHTAVTRFGFREIWGEGDRLLLNGTQLMPWGDHTVPYVYERQWLTRKFVDLADANVSIVEHHRYDPPPVFYDVADELGVFVVGANFCVGTGQVYTPAMDAREKTLVTEYPASGGRPLDPLGPQPPVDSVLGHYGREGSRILRAPAAQGEGTRR